MPDRQLTKAPRALNYRSGPLAIIGMRMDDITVTERAARRIGEILGREPPGTMLRVSVEGGGCSGFQYKFDIEHAKADDDLEIARDGAVVLIDPMSLQFMAGAEIDFVDDLIGASFKVANPNATAACGCGTSFSI
jgi:iron-sulfur cluster assembly accessory protein